MSITVRSYQGHDIDKMIQIWNEVVEEGNYFPREELLTSEGGGDLFATQIYVGVATDSETNEIYGLYVLHPNGVGRGHIFVIPVMQYGQKVGDFILAKN